MIEVTGLTWLLKSFPVIRKKSIVFRHRSTFSFFFLELLELIWFLVWFQITSQLSYFVTTFRFFQGHQINNFPFNCKCKCLRFPRTNNNSIQFFLVHANRRYIICHSQRVYTNWIFLFYLGPHTAFLFVLQRFILC